MKLTPPDGYRFNPILCPAHGPQPPEHQCAAIAQPLELQLACLATRPHAEGRFYLTDCTGCPRSSVLKDQGAPINIDAVNAMVWGTAFHEFLEKWSACIGDGGETEKRLEGELFGMPVSCRLDKIVDGVVVDYKTKGPDSFVWAIRNAKKGEIELPSPEHVWQIEAERFLLEQQGIETTGGRIYYMSSTAGVWPKAISGPPFPCAWTGPVWSESRLADFHPYGCPWTAKQLAEMAATRRPLDQLPLVGATINFGDKPLCDPRYCEVTAACSMAPVPDLEGVF